MKKLERIFLYSILAILVFYVFLVDGNVESQVAIQQEIRAKRMVIVNDVGQEVVELFSNNGDNGAITINNKNGTPAAFMEINKYSGGGVVGIYNKNGNNSVTMAVSGNYNDNGVIFFYNKYGKLTNALPSP